MRVQTKFGLQPVALLMYERGISARAFAKANGFTINQVRHAINGRCHPNRQLMIALCDLLDLEPEEAFTAEALGGAA